MAHQLSILNPNPKKIHGPELLHELVPQEVGTNIAAIEYLSPLGTVEQLSYAQLHRRANAFAQTLRSTWNKATATATSIPTYFVAPIYVPQSPELYIAELAALKAGAAFCPISLDIPTERLRFILRDVDAKILISTIQLRDGLPDLEGIKVIAVDDYSENDCKDLKIDVTPSQPAYIMYTSGSTGQPKGVVLSHSAATQALLAHKRHIPNFSRFLQFASPTFDVSVFEIFFPLFRGRTVVSGERRQMLNDLPGFISRMNIDAAELTPSVASSLLHGKQSVPSLKVLLTIGEMLKRDVIEEFGGTTDSDGILHGMYGPTEAAIHCTLQTSFLKTMSVGNIGTPIETVSAFVIRPSLSDNLQETIHILPVGEEGELAVGGHQLADGYLNRAAQTAASFIRHPHYGMLYRTGDRARLTSSGTLESLGRISSGQIKLRGQRVELGEIEHAASKAPGVRSVTADVIDGHLVIFCLIIVSTSEHHVREICRKWLPAFMVPADIVLLDALPYLSSGKVDRKALRVLHSERKQFSLSNRRRRTTIHRRIVEIISNVLQFPIENETKLAAVGFDSLSSIRIASELHRLGFPQLDAAILLESETIEDIESQLNQIQSATSLSDQNDFIDISVKFRDVVSNDRALSNRLEEIEDIFIATVGQSAMLSETARDSQAYCNWIELGVSGHEINRVHDCLLELAARHEILRAGFLSVNLDNAAHAIIIWKDLLPSQICHVHCLEYNFTIETQEDLMRPCSLQLFQGHDEVQVLLKIHHALYDQWSIDILRSDLASLLLGKRLPPCLAFRTVTHFFQENLQHFRSELVLDFWSDILRNFTPTSLLPMNGTAVPKTMQRTQWRILTKNLSSIRRKSRTLGCSSPTVFQAALSYLLGCYTGTSDVAFGVVFSGRHLPLAGMEHVFGPCLATLPLRIDCSAARTCLDLIRLIGNRIMDMQKHAFTPLQDIKKVRDCAPDVRLFDVLFMWQETSLSSKSEEKFVREVDSADHHEYNLVVEFEPDGEEVRIRVTYQQSLIPSSQVHILIEQIRAVVGRIVNFPETLVEKLADCLPQDLLSISNPQPTSCAAGKGLITAVENHALASPRSPALTFAKIIKGSCADIETLSYSEINMRSNKMARHLQSLNVLPNDLVCVCMEKSIDLYVGILAIIKAGAGYLPLTPDTPISRLKSILRQARVKTCLCDHDTAAKFHEMEVETVINVLSLDLLNMDTANLAIRTPVTQIAYTIFTSGSTGEPKGVVVTLENLLGNLQALQEIYCASPGDRLLQACSQAFDVSAFEIFFAFYTGICLCSAPRRQIFEDLEASIRALRISHLSLTPTVAALVDPKNVPSVRFLVTAGEGITNLVHQRWAGRGLHQGYGPSETTNICTVKMDLSLNDVLANIGRPLPNTSAFVISPNSAFDVLPSGSIGEFAFGGEQVFNGYLGMDSLNARKIFNHPNFGRIYKSGDIGRIMPNGSLLISGRIDDQIKIRGNRVELGEITSVLLRNPDVHDCTTVLIGCKIANQYLTSFIVPAQNPSRDYEHTQVISLESQYVGDLFDLLEEALPRYMVPQVILPINKLPLTVQGKLDKRELCRLTENLPYEKKRLFTHRRGDVDDAEAWSTEEIQIAEALKETLQISDATLARNESFFSFGLNSLNAIVFAKLLANRFEIRVSVSAVLHDSSIARLARALSQQSANNYSVVTPTSSNMLPTDVIDEVQHWCASNEKNIECVLPCTPLQEAMLSSAFTGSQSTYCNSLSLIIHGDLRTIKGCWKDMVRRHTILRTCFLSTTNPAHPYVQLVQKDLPLPWREHCLDSSEIFEFSRLRLENEALPIINENCPIYIEIYKSPRATLLILNMHHAIYDEISISTLLAEVETAYRGQMLPTPTSFVPFLSEIQRQSGEDAVEFWTAQIDGFRPTPFPEVHSSEVSGEAVLESRISIPHGDLEAYCKRHVVTHAALFQAAVVKVLACSQNILDVCFGYVVSGRTVPVDGVDKLVAPCFNTVPMRTKITCNSSNIKLIRHLNDKNIEILRFQLTPLRLIQGFCLSPTKRLFDALLILQPASHKLDSSIWDLQRASGNMGIPLVFEIIQGADHYNLFLHFLQSTISKELASKISQAFSAALASCIKYAHGEFEQFEGAYDDEIAGALLSFAPLNDGPSRLEGKFDQQQSPEETVIRQIYSQLSGVPERDIGLATSLYHLGLDSLNAPQVASRLRALGLFVDAADVMESPTPCSLAALIRTKSERTQLQDAELDLEAFDRMRREAVLKFLKADSHAVEAIRPCTSVQNGMLAQSLASDGNLYVNHITYAVPEEFCIAKLQAAWGLVSARHQVLRMGFHQHDAQEPFEMVIFCPHARPIPFIEIDEGIQLPDVERQASKAIMGAISKQPWQVTVQSHQGRNRMTLSLHHALYDEESSRVLLSDFVKALNSLELQDQTNIDGVLKSTLAAEADPNGETAAYWREVLQDISPSRFPDLAPALVQEGVLSSEYYSSSLPTSSLESFCRSNAVTIQALGQTAWSLLLSAYTSDENVVFGTVFARQASSTDRGIPFPCINTIPVPCKTNHSPMEVLYSMVNFNASVQRHWCAPLSGIQRLAGHAGRRLFDTVFVYQKFSSTSFIFDWPVVRETASVDYSAALELESNANGVLQICLRYNTSKIPAQQAILMVRQYDYMLMRLISSQIRHEVSLQSIWSKIPALEPELPSSVELLHSFVEETASKHPDRIALEFVHGISSEIVHRRIWTYEQLNGIANQVAHLISRSGLEPESMVAICMDKCPEASFAFVGTLKAGCTFVALDPELPENRLEFILEDSRASLLFGDWEERPLFLPGSVKYVKLSESLLTVLPRTQTLRRPVSNSATCYCLYTSGTTGTPKGCEISHQNAVQAMLAFQRLFAGRWTDSSRWLQFASYWFDVSILEQFWSWGVGITVVGAPRDLVLEDLSGFLRKLNISHIDLTPSLARLLQPDDAPSLWNGVFITGGEPLKKEIIDAWGPKYTICNGYGPTEATIGVTMNTFIGPDAKPSNIGHQFDNVGTYVLRPESDEPVFRGTIGELCVSGKLVGKGYLNRSDLTARYFPFIDRLGEKVYRTGDLVRMLADGSFAFIGRADSQTKLRGQRLELTEIENTIRGSSDEIHAVVCLVINIGDGEKETLVSFLAMATDQKPEALQFESSARSRRLAQIANQACISQLPGYMVPTHILTINQVPLTVNKKADTKPLVELFNSASTRELSTFQSLGYNTRPLNESEQKISKTLAKLLDIRSFDIAGDSNLFSLGLSSISAISFSRLLGQAGFSNTSIATVMRNPTLQQLSDALTTSSKTRQVNHSAEQTQLQMMAFHQRNLFRAASSLSVPIEDIEIVAPCSPLQQGLIVESMRNEHNSHFNDFHYKVDNGAVPQLKSALEKLVNTVEVLRTRFIYTDEGLAQVVLRRRFPTVSSWSLSLRYFEAFLAQLKAQWLARNVLVPRIPIEFHLVEQPISSYLIVHIHHALYDGVSYEQLLRLLSEIYGSGVPIDLGPSFIAGLSHGPLRYVPDAEIFWRRRLEGLRYNPLPLAGDVSSGHTSTITFQLGKKDDLETTRKKIGVSSQALMQACFEIVLDQCSPFVQIYGLVVSGRSIELEGADRVLGPMFNTLLQPLDINLDSTLADHIRLCHTLNVEAIPFQQTPLRDVRKWCSQQFADGMFDVLFVFQHKQNLSPTRADNLLNPIEKDPQAEYPLACEAELGHDGNLKITLLAQERYFDQKALEDFRDKLSYTMDCIMHENNVPLQSALKMRRRKSTHQPLKRFSSPHLVNGAYQQEWTESGRRIRELLSQVSNVDINEIHEHSTIFSLGVDSIDAVKLASKLRQNDLYIPVSKILQAQTIPRMVQILDSSFTSHKETRHIDKLQTINRQLKEVNYSTLLPNVRDIERILPATPNQEALIGDMLRSNLNEYFNHDVLRLKADTDLDKLKSAWEQVIDATPILRTLFLEISDPYVDCVFAQIVCARADLHFAEYECTSFEGVGNILNGIRDDVLANFRSSPPFRLSIITIDSTRYLIVSLAHAQYDGHSLALLHEDVSRAYNDDLQARPAYDDAIEVALAGTQDDAKMYWVSMLAGARRHVFRRSAKGEERSKVHRSERYSNTSADQARTFCQSQGVSMQALVATAWSLTLSYYVGDLDVLFGITIACRDSEEREQVLFPMMNTVVLRSTLHGSRAQMLQHMQGLITHMLPYQRTPLRKIQAAGANGILQDDSGLRKSLFDTLCIYQQRPNAAVDMISPMYESVGGNSNVEYPVAVEMEVVGQNLAIRAACKDNALDEQGTLELVNRIEDVLQALVTSPDEATVRFHGDTVSICGLQPIVLASIHDTDLETEDAEVKTNNKPEAVTTALTSTIMRTLADVSKTPQREIGSGSTIESIGIDSISAIKVSAILRKHSIKISVSEIIRAKTPSRMAEIASASVDYYKATEASSTQWLVEAVQDYNVDDIAAKISWDARNIERVIPATAGQVYMISVWQKTRGHLFYSTFCYRLKTDLSMQQIEQAWAVLVDRHPILRTVFYATSNSKMPLLQVVLNDVPASFTQDLNTDYGRRKRQPMVYVRGSINDHGFNLELTLHHALYDAVSLPLLMRDFQSLLARTPLPRPRLKFEDFIILSLEAQSRQARKNFWTRYLRDTKPLKMSQPVSDKVGKRVELFEPHLFSAIVELENTARKEAVSMQALLFAAYAKIYASLASKEDEEAEGVPTSDVVLGIYLSNRAHLAELDSLPAPTLNMVPLLVRKPLDKSLLEAAREVHTDLQNISTVENSAIGLWEIYEWTGVKIDTFVNFIKLPESDEQIVEGGGEARVVLEALDERRTRERKEIVEMKEEHFEVPPGLRELPTDAYQHALDIEMTITDGSLAVGFFCPEAMVGLDEAQSALEGLKGVLEKFVGKAKA